MQDTGVEGMDRDRDEGLVELAPELVHKVALGGWLGVRDVAALSQTCRRMADILVWDEYGRDLHHALEGVVENARRGRWKAARYAMCRGWYGGVCGDGGGGGVWKEVAEIVAVDDEESVLKDKDDLEEWENIMLAALSLPGASGELLTCEHGPYGRRRTSALHVAALVGSEKVVERVLEGGGDLEARDWREATPLWRACGAGQLEVARMLVERGADVMAKNDISETVLLAASQCGHVGLLTYLVGLGVLNAEEGDRWGKTPLRAACMRGYLEVATYLVEEVGVDVDVEGQDPLGAIYWACQGGVVEIVRLVVGAGSGSGVGKDGGVWVSGLGIAAAEGHVDIVEELMRMGVGVGVDEVDGRGYTALISASQYGRVDVVNVLLGQGHANVNKAGKDGKTPLYWACYGGKEEVVKVLLEAGADVGIVADDGKTGLDVARRRGWDDVVRVLEQAGAGGGGAWEEEGGWWEML